MDYVMDVNQIQAVPKEHSDNQHLVRRDDFKVGVISVRPHDELPVHVHVREDQFYYVLEGEGVIQMADQEIPLKPGLAVTIPPGVRHGVKNPNDRPLRYLDIFINWPK